MSEEKEIKEIIENYKKDAKDISYEEAQKILWDIKSLARIIVESHLAEESLKKRLVESPNGFIPDEDGTCRLCGRHNKKENLWYDQHGIKCSPCQNAVNEKIVPVEIIGKSELWYSSTDLEYYFNIGKNQIKNYIGLLKPRDIMNGQKKVHLRLFLIKDNEDVLPPKELIKSRSVIINKKGVEYHSTLPWYYYVDQKLFKEISKYKISTIFIKTFSQPIKNQGHLLAELKTVNPLFHIKDIENAEKIFED